MSVRLEPLATADPLALPLLSEELQQRWLVWDAWVAGQRRVDLHPLVLSAEAHRAAVSVAERAASLVFAAGDRAAQDVRERARYRLHPDVERLAGAARSAGDLGALARVDLLLEESGRFVACEVNADCPGGYNETLALPRLARLAGMRGLRNPTSIAHRLVDRLIALSGGPGSPRGVIALVYATGFAEDLQVCALLERLVRERGGRAVRAPATAIARLDAHEPGASVVGYRGERISVLYRFYPIEYMAEQRNIEAIAVATERGELASMASFASVFAQSKLAMARAFALDPVAAREVFPETVAFADRDPTELVRDRDSWVLKRDLSRVGDHVFVGALASEGDFRELTAGIAQAEAEGDLWIAQRFVKQQVIPTPWGDRFVTLGAYVLDGAFAGYYARLSAVALCSHEALVVPVFVDESVREAAA